MCIRDRDAAFGVDSREVLFRPCRGRQDDVGGMRALVAMMADINFEALVEGRKIDLIGAEEEGQLGLGGDDVLDPARMRIACLLYTSRCV